MKEKIKLGIILGVEFVTIAVILILIFFAGKKTYTVRFDLNGGTLISGEVEQVVQQGQSATPPTVAKDGCYLYAWSASYKQITKDVVIKAVWEWETSVGFDYEMEENSNYCVIKGCFPDLVGDVYVGVYYNSKKVLGIKDGAFSNCDGITYIHMLDGILSIGEGVFEGCDSLVAVELPGTLAKLGKNAFKDCVSLETIVIPESLKVIPAGAFAGCTSLKEVVIPSTVEVIEAGAFAGCTSLEKITFETAERSVGEDDETAGENDESETAQTVLVGLRTLGDGVFSGCTSLTEVILPVTLENIGELAFDNEELTVYVSLNEEEKPESWSENWSGSSKIEWEYVPAETEPEETETEEKHGWLS